MRKPVCSYCNGRHTKVECPTRAELETYKIDHKISMLLGGKYVWVKCDDINNYSEMMEREFNFQNIKNRYPKNWGTKIWKENKNLHGIKKREVKHMISNHTMNDVLSRLENGRHLPQIEKTR